MQKKTNIDVGHGKITLNKQGEEENKIKHRARNFAYERLTNVVVQHIRRRATKLYTFLPCTLDGFHQPVTIHNRISLLFSNYFDSY